MPLGRIAHMYLPYCLQKQPDGKYRIVDCGCLRKIFARHESRQ